MNKLILFLWSQGQLHQNVNMSEQSRLRPSLDLEGLLGSLLPFNFYHHSLISWMLSIYVWYKCQLKFWMNIQPGVQCVQCVQIRAAAKWELMGGWEGWARLTRLHRQPIGTNTSEIETYKVGRSGIIVVENIKDQGRLTHTLQAGQSQLPFCQSNQFASNAPFSNKEYPS